MDDFLTDPHIREQVLEVAGRRDDVAAAYLLGSAAHGRMRPDSDIDVALLPARGRDIPLPARLELAAELERRLGRNVDLGVITPANLIYAAEAILNGRRLVTMDEEFTAETETRLLGCYLQLKQDRREVEKAYRVA